MFFCVCGLTPKQLGRGCENTVLPFDPCVNGFRSDPKSRPTATTQTLLDAFKRASRLAALLGIVPECANRMYGPPPRRKRKMKMTGWSAQMYSAFVGAQSSWP